MPEPPQRTAPAAPPTQSPAAPSASSGGKRNTMVLAVAVGVGVLALAVGAIAIFALRKNPQPAAPAVTQAPPAAPATAPAPSAAPATAPAAPAAVAETPAPKPASTPVGALDQIRAIWGFDQDSGNTVIDTTGNGYNATVAGGDPSWLKAGDPGKAGLRLSGSNYVEVSGAVVNTARSFTVMARVNLDLMEAKRYQTFVSIDGREISGFFLQLNPYAGQGTGRFEFDRMEEDARNATKVSAKAKSPVSTNTWYHLAGVYDADAGEMSLYLDGKMQETVPFSKGWQATGKTAIGRARNFGHNVNFLCGAVRDVRIYASALTADQIKKLAK